MSALVTTTGRPTEDVPSRPSSAASDDGARESARFWAYLRSRSGHGITFGDGRKSKNVPPVSGFNRFMDWPEGQCRLGRLIGWGGGLMHKAWKDIEPTVSDQPWPPEPSTPEPRSAYELPRPNPTGAPICSAA